MKELLQLLTRLCPEMSQAMILSTYFTARLIISYSEDSDYEKTIRSSGQLSRAMFIYKSVVSDVAADQIDIWIALCKLLVETGLDKDYHAFVEMATPNAVVNWTPFYRTFGVNNIGRLLVALCLVSRATLPVDLNYTNDWLQECYTGVENLCKTIGLDRNTYMECWRAVHVSGLASSEHVPSVAITQAKKLYHSLQLPMTDLLDDYARLYLQEDEVAQKIATCGARKVGRTNPVAEGGKSNRDVDLKRVLMELSTENPVDVIRGLFYPPGRNDSGFECTYLMGRFRTMVGPEDKVAIMNPSPDMVRQLMQNRILCKELWIYVADHTVECLYTKQYGCNAFRSMDSIDQVDVFFDRVLITARDQTVMPMLDILLHTTAHAKIMMLIPEVSLKEAEVRLDSAGICIHNILAVSAGATQSSPRKKVLVEANTWWESECFILQRGVCDGEQTLFGVEKTTRIVPRKWIQSKMTISDMRKAIDLKLVARKTSEPMSVRYTPEITIPLTVQMDRGGKCAGRVYYRRILRPEDKHRKRGDRLTPIIEKGLRHNTVEEVVAAVETVVLDERLAPAIVDDVLDAYAGRIHELSFKTGWFCIRWRLLTKYGYKEELVLELFARGDDLALISIGTNNPLVYENAMENLFKGEVAVPKKYWEQLVLILNTAKEAEFIEQNPLSNHMIIIANRMTKRQQEVRNALTKKTFEIGEEKILLNDMFAQEQGYATWMETNPSHIALPIAAMATPDYREVAALRWMDMVQIGKLDSYQFQITQYIASNGALRPVFDRKPELRRCIPLAAPLANLLLAYKAYLKRKYNLSDEQLALVPIVLFDHRVLDRIDSRKNHGDPVEISRLIKRNIDSLGIQPLEVILPDEKEDKASDLNAYGGNILRSNLRYRLRHLCKYTEGELCYFLGQKAPDTFSAHYCAYDHPALQQRMVCKLNRWMGVLAPSDEDGRIINHKEKVIFGEETLVLSADGYGTVHADVSIMPEEGSTMESMSVKISSDHGVTGTIITMNRNKEDEHGNK